MRNPCKTLPNDIFTITDNAKKFPWTIKQNRTSVNGIWREEPKSSFPAYSRFKAAVLVAFPSYRTTRNLQRENETRPKRLAIIWIPEGYFATSFFYAVPRVARVRYEPDASGTILIGIYVYRVPTKRNFGIVSLGARIKFSFVRVMESGRVRLVSSRLASPPIAAFLGQADCSPCFHPYQQLDRQP